MMYNHSERITRKIACTPAVELGLSDKNFKPELQGFLIQALTKRFER
jgi:hypothetical protein